ncbi:Cupin domain-containing protein [Collimonas sp. PA-H2]|uniref:cupin domain-containing protein n=1 Tax=Collimonas sp. PA-H2 TaxID=1881062 RepID=UPI000BF428E6|nr:cupin domain-containing protein [Collimonas sp. PA-H2]PFH08465.1 Cupin domain-containing protein [Collimonas sp. PA-H2]
MKNLSKILLALGSLLLSSQLLAAEGGSHAKHAGALISLPAADLQWTDIPGSGGIKYANVHGNLSGKGPYEAFVIFPAGKDNPFHTHSQNLPTVVLKGTFYAVIDGQRVEYPAGSFYNLPARLPHYSGCNKGEDCLLFQYQADHFDLLPQTPKS